MEEKEFDYINIIPLVDVMLVLLTIVLTSSTFIATGVIPIELPKASVVRQEIMKTQTVEIDRKGNIFLNSQPMTLAMLDERLGLLERSTPVLIRADRSIELQVFVDALALIKKLGFKRVSLQTEGAR